MSVQETPLDESRLPAAAPRTSRDPAETRRRLVGAGTLLFASRGLHGVTSARIAKAAGVATGTFYLHFKDKEALFREIVFDALARLRARQDRASERVGRGSAAEARARTEELLRFAEDNGDLIRVVFGRGGESATLGEEVIDAIVPDVEQRLAERRADGRVPRGLHPAVAAQALAAMTVRVLAWWIENPRCATRDEVVETLLRMSPGATGGAAES